MPRSTENKDEPARPVISNAHDILMNAPIGVLTSDPEGLFLSANTATAWMFGCNSPEGMLELVTDIAAQLYADPSDREEITRLLRERGAVLNFVCRTQRRDGTIIWWPAVIQPSVTARKRQNQEQRVFYPSLTTQRNFW